MSTYDSPVDPPGEPSESAETYAVSLLEILERHVALTWPEAVAIMAEVCRVVAEAAPAATGIPEPDCLFVSSDGSVQIGSWSREMGIADAARMMNALLAGAQPPTPLRQFIGHAISSDQFASVGEMGDALAYYERPGRTELIQTAFQRFLATPPDLPAPEPVPVMEPEAVESRPAGETSSQRKGVGRLLTAAVFLLVFGGGVTISMRILTARPGSGSSGPTLQSVTAQATSEFAGLKRALRDLGLPISVDAPRTPVPTTVDETPQRAAPVPRRPAVRALPPVPTSAAGVPGGAIAPGPSQAEVSGQRLTPEPALAQATVTDAADDENVYTNESGGVSPPVIVDARVLPASHTGTGPRTLNRIELVIGTDGRVEQVLMVSRLERLPDLMLLSGAKHWIFKPATKDGRPVRYRLPVTWSVRLQ